MYIYEQISIYCDFSNNNNNNEAASKVPSSLVLETKGLNLERQPGRGPALLRVGGSREGAGQPAHPCRWDSGGRWLRNWAGPTPSLRKLVQEQTGEIQVLLGRLHREP